MRSVVSVWINHVHDLGTNFIVGYNLSRGMTLCANDAIEDDEHV